MQYLHDDELVGQMVHAARNFYNLRYEMSNGGNLSIRIPETELMMVKGTDVAFDEVDSSTLVVTDFEGKLIEGTRKPSKETLLHGALYKVLPEIGAIMHCHSPYATAWATTHDSLEFSTHHAEMKLGNCPVIDTNSYVVPSSYFPDIIQRFRDDPKMKSFILRKHGQVTVGKTMRDAAYLAELVEETAEIAVLVHSIHE
jgi:L-ribulose-5-phosphate 4-epimerase